MRYLIALLFSLVLIRSAEAQKNCKKGIPCGNSCISADKTCRIGSTSSAPAPAYDPPARNVSPAPITAAAPVVEPESDGWVGLVNGKVYYRASCQAAKELPQAMSFPSAAEAERVGYKRSKVPGC